MRNICWRFGKYFAHWGIQLPAEAVVKRERGELVQAGWSVRWLFGTDDDGEFLDFYAVHRMTNDRHVRIRENGEMVHLEAMADFMVVGKEDEYYRRNRRVARMLKRKGF